MYGLDNKSFKYSNIYNTKSLRASAGMSLIWKSTLGTITISYAAPYMKKPFDDQKRFNIDFGTNF